MGFVRAKGPDGAEFTIDEQAAKAMGEDVKILTGKDAVDGNGRPLPFKPVTDKAGKDVANTPGLSWKLADLEKHATDNSIEFAKGSTKADILAAIAAADQSQEG